MDHRDPASSSSIEPVTAPRAPISLSFGLWRGFRVRCLALVLVAIVAVAYADPPTYDASWERNNNVKILTIWSLNGGGTTETAGGQTYVQFTNGQVCHIPPYDDNLLALILTLQAQGRAMHTVCYVDPSSNVEGISSRRLHRIKAAF